jgi:hypothetical protein
MARRKSWIAIAIFTSTIALSYGLAQLSRALNLNTETVALSSIRPVSGRVYPSRGDLSSGDPVDINGRSGGGDEIAGILLSSCGPNAVRGNYQRQRFKHICSLLRNVDPRLSRLEYVRAAPELLGPRSEPN